MPSAATPCTFTGRRPPFATCPNRARLHGPLRDIYRAERGKPRFCGREALRQIGTSKAGHNNGLACGEQAIHDRSFVVRQANIAFTIRDAHEDCRNCDVVRVRRWKLHYCGSARKVVSIRTVASESTRQRISFSRLLAG